MKSEQKKLILKRRPWTPVNNKIPYNSFMKTDSFKLAPLFISTRPIKKVSMKNDEPSIQTIMFSSSSYLSKLST